MEIPEKHREELMELLKQCRCRKNPNCLDRNPDEIQQIIEMKNAGLYECSSIKYCDFALSFGNTHFCQCPVRIYLKKHFDI